MIGENKKIKKTVDLEQTQSFIMALLKMTKEKT